jgi:orotidine-5'-phosphate decarboxylase
MRARLALTETRHMPVGERTMPRDLPPDMKDRLIVALDVPTIAGAREMVARLDGVVSFFKVGLWLAFAEGVDGLLHSLISSGKKVFLDAKMYDIGRTVEEGVARAADRGVSLLTVHGDARIMESAVKGKGSSPLKIFAISVLTSLDDASLKEMGYALTARELIHLRAKQAVQFGCDGLIASAADDPNEVRRIAGSDRLLIGTPGIRGAGDTTDDHARLATPAAAIERGSDYLVVGRPIIAHADPAARARQIIAEMEAGGRALAG